MTVDGSSDTAQGLLGADLTTVPDTEVRRAMRFIGNTEVVEVLEDRLRSRRRSPAGRPPTVTVRALLTGLLLAATLEDNVLLSTVSRILHYHLTPSSRTALEVPSRPLTASGVEAGYQAVRRRFHAVVDLFDDSPNPRNRRLLDKDLRALQRALTEEERSRRHALRNWVGNQLLAPSWTEVLDLMRSYPATGTCTDATPVKTRARKPAFKAGISSADPDAGLYLRTNDSYADSGRRATSHTATKKKNKIVLKELYGYEATFAVGGCTDELEGHIAPPALILGFTIKRPGHEPGPAAIDALKSAVHNGWAPGLLAADRAYNNSTPDNFQLPARALGFRPLFDYKIDQLGIQAEHAGAIQVEGRWYSPALPQVLIDATLDYRAGTIDETEWKERIERRRPFELRPKEAPDAEGHQRMLCPASGPSPKLNCPLKPASMGDVRRLTIHPEPGPAGPPSVCRQATITIPPEAGAKHAQALPYGTPEWERAYYGLRNSNEGINGYAKDTATTDIETNGKRQIRGIAATQFLLAFQLAAVNLRKQRAWYAVNPPDPQTPARIRKRPRRRKTTSITDWAPAAS